MTVATVDVARAAGVTYRQLDYWARCGLVRAEHEGSGSGVPRRWCEHELHVAELLGRLTRAGLTLEAAAPIARGAVDDGRPTYYAHLGDGLYLSLVLDVSGAGDATRKGAGRTRARAG